MFQSYHRAPLGTGLSAHYQTFFSRKGGRVCMWISFFATELRICILSAHNTEVIRESLIYEYSHW